MERNERGITLIALVVTIVVLLILAAVSISMLTGENGIVTKAKEATEKWKLGEDEEKNKLNSMEEIMNSILGEETKAEDSNPGNLAGDGTEENPFLIESIEDLVAFSNNVNAGESYEGKLIILKQTLNFTSDNSYIDPNRIDFGDINGDQKTEALKIELTTGKGFIPIGNVEEIQRGSDDWGTDTCLVGKSFKGIFDGNEKAIKELYINIGTDEYGRGIGLFGWNEGTIKNLVTTGTINDTIGLVCGGVSGFSNGTIEKCINNINITSKYAAAGIVGGEIGELFIDNAVNNGKITAKYVGGIIGIIANDERTANRNLVISNSCNKNQIEGEDVGGLIGQSKDTSVDIISCWNEAKVVTNHIGGGIVGQIDNGLYEEIEIRIFRSYNKGEILGQSVDEEDVENIGGIVGYADDWGEINYIDIYNCYNKGKLTNAVSVGGIVGKSRAQYGKIDIYDCYNLGEVYGNIYSGGIVGNTEATDTDARINIKTSYNAGILVGKQYIGGITGNIRVTSQVYSDEAGKIGIINCYNVGEIKYENSQETKFVGGICGMVNNDKGDTGFIACCNIGDINITRENVGGILGKVITSNNGSNNIEGAYHNNQNLGAVNGKDISGSAEFSENMPNILDIIGTSFKESADSEFPILNWQEE